MPPTSLTLTNGFFIFRTEYLFSFNDKFEINDDFEVLKKMGLVLGEINCMFVICSQKLGMVCLIQIVI